MSVLFLLMAFGGAIASAWFGVYLFAACFSRTIGSGWFLGCHFPHATVGFIVSLVGFVTGFSGLVFRTWRANRDEADRLRRDFPF